MKKSVKKSIPKLSNKSGAEKPVSLWGASFTAVLDALLKTRPMPKEKSKKEGKAK